MYHSECKYPPPNKPPPLLNEIFWRISYSGPCWGAGNNTPPLLNEIDQRLFSFRLALSGWPARLAGQNDRNVVCRYEEKIRNPLITWFAVTREISKISS